MGASNAVAAMDLYAGLVPPTSLLLLVRMALVSVDAHKEPWYAEGHEALARHALGRGRHAAVGRKDIKAVERAIEPLHEVGAITVVRKAAIRVDGHSTVKYRLHLDRPAEIHHVPRKVGGVKPADNPVEDPPRPPESGPHVPHFPDSRPPLSGLTSPGKRGTEEYEEYEERELQGGRKDLRPDLTVARAPEAVQDPISSVAPSPAASGGGHGFCVPCHRLRGQFVLAADPQTGAACAMHLRDPDWDSGRNATVIPFPTTA